MTTLDVFIEKGRKIGEAKGVQKEREKTVYNLTKQALLTDEQIALALEVSVKYVAEVRKQTEGGK